MIARSVDEIIAMIQRRSDSGSAVLWSSRLSTAGMKGIVVT